MCARRISELTKEEEKRAMDFYQKAIVIDGLMYAPDFPDPGHMIRTLQEAGITAVHFTSTISDATAREALPTISGWYQTAEKVGCRIAYSVDDILSAKKEGKFCAILGSQNGKILDRDVNLVRIFHRLGMRIIQLAYFEQNYIGSSTEDVDAGVSLFGRKVIEEMNRVGVLIDLSHCGYKTVMDAIKYSNKPVAFTHANPRKLADNPRNKTDEQLLALAEKGGFIGICAWGPFAAIKKGVRPTIEDFLDLMDYVVNLIGIDHVGLGLDLGMNGKYGKTYYERYTGQYPMLNLTKWEDHAVEGLEHPKDVRNIARGLVARGYSDANILKILGGNLLELYKKVWNP